MTKRFTTQKEHDNVIIASSTTYEEYRKKGYIISVNLTEHPCHNVGGGNFPDLVIWQPGGEFGKTEIIEEIETSESINEKAAVKWERYSKLCQTFYLIVPKKFAKKAEEITKIKNIAIDMIQCYEIDNQNRIIFSTIQGKALWPPINIK